MIIALLVAAGLAIDGGMAFLERWRMQNAADAAALSGTRLLATAICGKTEADDAAIAAEVNRYAEQNGVRDTNSVVADYVDFDEVVLGRVGDGIIPTGSTGISVTVAITSSTYFVSLIGIDEAGASAYALAMTGPPLVMGGLRPFGIPLDVVTAIEPGAGEDSCFTVGFDTQCDQDDKCLIDYLDGQTSSHRGWMNLAYVWNQGEDSSDWLRAIDHSGDASHLGQWMEDGYNGHVIYADGPWSAGYRYGDHIHAKPGKNSSVIKHTPEDELFYVPIFDQFPNCDGDPALLEEPYPDDRAEGGDACVGGQGADYYHIVGFAGVTVPEGGADQGGGTITACLEETIIGESQPSPNQGYGSDACATHTMVVTLWH